MLKRLGELTGATIGVLMLGAVLAQPSLADRVVQASTANGPVSARDTDALWRSAEAASARGDCEVASGLYRKFLDAEPAAQKRIAATHALVLCVAGPEEPWAARDMMAELLPEVIRHFGPQSAGLARHHAIWAEAEVRAGALNVAWRRSEAAIAAARAAGDVDPFDHAAELYRLAAIQLARGEGDSFLAFLARELQLLVHARWAAAGDGDLFMEVMGVIPQPGDTQALATWTRLGLEEFDPRQLYLSLVDRAPA
ncbi:MAG: hypothetical protein AAFN17_10490 [Pseudomonadota bacterium]